MMAEVIINGAKTFSQQTYENRVDVIEAVYETVHPYAKETKFTSK